jgi:hypothetical protein
MAKGTFTTVGVGCLSMAMAIGFFKGTESLHQENRVPELQPPTPTVIVITATASHLSLLNGRLRPGV